MSFGKFSTSSRSVISPRPHECGVERCGPFCFAPWPGMGRIERYTQTLPQEPTSYIPRAQAYFEFVAYCCFFQSKES